MSIWEGQIGFLPETATVLLHTLEAESSRARQNHPKHHIAGRLSLLENLENIGRKNNLQTHPQNSPKGFKKAPLIQSHQHHANKSGRNTGLCSLTVSWANLAACSRSLGSRVYVILAAMLVRTKLRKVLEDTFVSAACGGFLALAW